MTMKKKILTTLSVVLILGLAALGILAYLQDEDSDVNVMTLGEVKIEQIEQERDADGKLVDFTQGKPLYPYVGEVAWNDEVININGHDYKMFGDKLKNAVDKIITVKNTGKSDAYVRTIVALEDPFDISLIGVNVGGVGYTQTPWFTANIDGVQYSVTAFTYKEALKPNNETLPSFLQVYLKNIATNEDVAKLGDAYEILAVSQAAQTNGFDDAATALDTAFGEVEATTVAAWFKGMSDFEYVDVNGTKVSVEGEQAEAILNDLNNGKNVMADENIDIIALDTNNVDAKGATAILNGQGPEAYGYLAFLPDAGDNVTVSNLNVTGSGFVEVGHYGQGGGDYTLNNVKIENLAATLKNENKGFYLGCAFMGFGDTTLNNCVMTGTTAVQDGTIPVDLGCGQAWSGYTDGNDNMISTTINGGEYGTVYCWSHALVTINGAEIDTLYASPINGKVTINAGTEIDTLKVAYGTSAASDKRLAKLVVEDGANVGKIVFSDKDNTEKVFNTVAEWNAYVASL